MRRWASLLGQSKIGDTRGFEDKILKTIHWESNKGLDLLEMKNTGKIHLVRLASSPEQ